MTTTTHDRTTAADVDPSIDLARDIVRRALYLYADAQLIKTDSDDLERGVIAQVMAGNVAGWTHTTRLREFCASPRTLIRIARLHDEARAAKRGA